MAELDDRELLIAYARNASEDAFTQIVRRHLDLVYSVALRSLGDSERAKDATQAVFLILARKAKTMPPHTLLSGWLYRTTRYVSLAAARADYRRKLRENTMADLLEPAPHDTQATWKQLSPHLDKSLEQLSDSDRNALLLRFFQGKSIREIGETLGIGEEAAKKRVARALERLRQRLAAVGITNSNLLGAALTAYAVQPAPTALASLACTAGLGSAAAPAATVLMEGTLQMIALTKAKTAALCAAVVLLTAGTATVTVQNAELAETQTRLKQQIAGLQSQQVQTDQFDAQSVASLENENRQLRQQAVELHRLRNEVAQLQRTRSSEPSLGGVRLASLPEPLREAAETLRESQYAKFVAAGAKALSELPLQEPERIEYNAEIDFMKHIGLALRIYSTDHGDEYPERIEQLFGTGILNETMERQLQDSRYEYIRFNKAETKPQLPAVWWRVPDERGIRILVFNDGSAQLIREPVGVELPGQIP